MKNINFEYYFKRLLMMNAMGVYVTARDGHNWIELDEECEYHAQFDTVSLNNKIYHGILEAIDTFDEALIQDGQDSLLTRWEEYGKYEYQFTNVGADMTRIYKVKSGRGGVY